MLGMVLKMVSTLLAKMMVTLTMAMATIMPRTLWERNPPFLRRGTRSKLSEQAAVAAAWRQAVHLPITLSRSASQLQGAVSKA